MLEKYKNRNIKILVSSDSGIAAKGELAGESYNGMIVVTGVLNDFDNNYIEIENSKIIYCNLYSTSGKYNPEIIQESSTSMLINRNKIISIMLL